MEYEELVQLVRELENKMVQLERQVKTNSFLDDDFDKTKIVRRDVTFKGDVTFEGTVVGDN